MIKYVLTSDCIIVINIGGVLYDKVCINFRLYNSR